MSLQSLCPILLKRKVNESLENCKPDSFWRSTRPMVYSRIQSLMHIGFVCSKENHVSLKMYEKKGVLGILIYVHNLAFEELQRKQRSIRRWIIGHRNLCLESINYPLSNIMAPFSINVEASFGSLTFHHKTLNPLPQIKFYLVGQYHHKKCPQRSECKYETCSVFSHCFDTGLNGHSRLFINYNAKFYQLLIHINYVV